MSEVGSQTFSYTHPGGWERVAGAKTRVYLSEKYGDVVLILWANGDISIQRQTTEGVTGTHISDECLKEIKKLKEPEPELALAVGKPETPRKKK